MYFSKSFKLILIGVLWLFLPKDGYAADKPYSKPDTLDQQLPKVLLLDRYMSPYAGASLIISTRLWLNELEHQYLLPQNAPSNWLMRWVSATYNNLANDLLMLTAHEVYGHGSRFRNYGRVLRYQYDVASFSWLLSASLFPVHGTGASTTGEYRNMMDIRLLTTIAGTESNTVLASEILKAHFNSGILDHRTANLFFKSFVDLLLYIQNAPEEGAKDSHDIASYLVKITKKHGFEGIKLNDLKSASLVYLLNPMLYSSIWSFYAYIFGEQKELPIIPRLTWEHMAYMPIIRMGLTPFGLTYYLDNYLAIDKQVFSVSLNAGSSPFYTSYYGGLTCQTSNLWSYEAYTVDLTGSVWHQPKLQLDPNSPVFNRNDWGGLVGITNKFQLNDRFSIIAAIHYKTEGFLEGVVADSGLGLRAGLELSY
jgi:hypothetical protein